MCVREREIEGGREMRERKTERGRERECVCGGGEHVVIGGGV